MKESIYQKAGRGEAIGSGELIYSVPRLSPEKLKEFRQNYSCTITEELLKEVVEDLIYLGAQPTEENIIELFCAKGLLELDSIKKRILNKADIRENDKAWVKAYKHRIRDLERYGVKI